MITKHAKPSMANQEGGIIHLQGPIDISNVMLLIDGKTTRVGFHEYIKIKNVLQNQQVK